MKLTYQQCLLIDGALRNLDGTYEKLIEDGKTRKIFNARIELSMGVRVANGMRLHKLETPLKLFKKLEQDLLFKLGEAVDDAFKVPPENFVEWTKARDALLDTEIDVDIELIKDDDLKLEANPAIGGQVLQMLAPIRAGIVDERKDQPTSD